MSSSVVKMPQNPWCWILKYYTLVVPFCYLSYYLRLPFFVSYGLIIYRNKFFCSKFFSYFVWTANLWLQISISEICWFYSNGMACTLLQKVLPGSLKAAQRVLVLRSRNNDNSMKKLSGLESENESYTWQQMVYLLVKVIGEHSEGLFLCFWLFRQLWLHPVCIVDINSYLHFGMGRALFRKTNICTAISR